VDHALTIDTLISVIALGFAAISIMPEHRRKAFLLRINSIDYFIVFLIVLFAAIFHFQNILREQIWFPKYFASEDGLSESQWNLLVFAAGTITITIRGVWPRPKRTTTDKILRLVDELIVSRRSADLGWFILHHILPPKSKNSIPGDEQQRNEVLEGIIERLSDAPGVNLEVNNIYPQLFAFVVNSDLEGRFTFVDDVLRLMIRDNRSRLYRELKKINNRGDDISNVTKDDCPILVSLFQDPQVAVDQYAWKPIGDEVIAELDRRHLIKDQDLYNWPDDNSFNEQWDSLLMPSIIYFNVMINAGLTQGVRDHFWMYYFRYFAEGICRNIKFEEGVNNVDQEFPSRYCYALYEMMDCAENWARCLGDHKIERINRPEKIEYPPRMNRSIPICALIVLVEILHVVVRSDILPDRFKRDQVQWVVELYFNLQREYPSQLYSKVLEQCLSGDLYLVDFDEFRTKISRLIDWPEIGVHFDPKVIGEFRKKTGL